MMMAVGDESCGDDGGSSQRGERPPPIPPPQPPVDSAAGRGVLAPLGRAGHVRAHRPPTLAQLRRAVVDGGGVTAKTAAGPPRTLPSTPPTPKWRESVCGWEAQHRCRPHQLPVSTASLGHWANADRSRRGGRHTDQERKKNKCLAGGHSIKQSSSHGYRQLYSTVQKHTRAMKNKNRTAGVPPREPKRHKRTHERGASKQPACGWDPLRAHHPPQPPPPIIHTEGVTFPPPPSPPPAAAPRRRASPCAPAHTPQGPA